MKSFVEKEEKKKSMEIELGAILHDLCMLQAEIYSVAVRIPFRPFFDHSFGISTSTIYKYLKALEF